MNLQSDILSEAFLSLCRNHHFHGKWMTSEVWVELMQVHSTLPSDTLSRLDIKMLNTITSQRTAIFSSDLFTPNVSGVFQCSFQNTIVDSNGVKHRYLLICTPKPDR